MSKHEFKYECGEILQDVITGFVGVVMGRTHYITGCDRYTLQSTELDKGKPGEWLLFDEHLLKPIGKPKIETTENEGKKTKRPYNKTKKGGVWPDSVDMKR